MLVLRLARTGRKKHATYRLVAADSRRAAQGKYIAQLGHYNPHTKELVFDKDQVDEYIKKGAQPSGAVVRLLKQQKVSLPAWAEANFKEKKKAPKKKVESETKSAARGKESAEAEPEAKSAEGAKEPKTEDKKEGAAPKEEKPESKSEEPKEEKTEPAEKPQKEAEPEAKPAADVEEAKS